MTTLAANAQNGIDSPYSRYGFGILSDRTTGFNKGMGGVAQGFRDGKQINLGNPASYSEVDSVTALFDMGVALQNGNYKMGEQQQNVKNTSFDGISFQFRAAKNVGVTVGLMPISNIKYKFASQNEPLPGTENTSSYYSYSGDGGLREVLMGVGWRPFKPISIGVNAGYVWGEYNHKMNSHISESTAYSMARTYSADISTYNLQLGLQYIQPISKEDKIVVGATYSLGHDVSSDANRSTETLTNSSMGYVTQSQKVDIINNAFQLPHSFAAGLTYYKSNRIRVAADFELQKWSDCKFPNQTTVQGTGGTEQVYTASKGQLNDRMKIALGMDLTPKENSRKLSARTTYKIGGYYSQSYAKADPSGIIGDKPLEYGVSAGVSMPIYSRWLIFSNMSKLNISAQWVRTEIPYLSAQSMKKNTLTENYLRLCVGVSINEAWFYKWKLR